MTLLDVFTSSLPAVGWVLAAMAVVAAIEVAVPLRARSFWNRAHLAPNLALTGITFATSLVMNGALLLGLAQLQDRGFGLLSAIALPSLAAGVVAVVLLDLSFYASHVLMHALPGWWRFHRVHHADPAVDVTTSLRQHPVEGLIRYAFLALFAVVLVPSPAAFALYRAASALSAVLEHANVRVPQRLDRALSLVTTWPNLHKVHHSRDRAQTDSNYGNLFSLWDRLFGTLRPSAEGVHVAYGLDGFDAPQSLVGLLAAPWRMEAVPSAVGPVESSPVARA
jgi:sterol desaturase/sphingolipid hydroxylase (fatty acid hydroxylase superfamily)